MLAYVYKSLKKADTYVYLAARDDFTRLPEPLRTQLGKLEFVLDVALTPERKLARAVAEEAARGGVDAIGAAAEIDAVEVELEDLVLGEFPLQRQCQHAFLDLAAKGPAVGEEDVPGQLLGNG